MAIVQKYVLSIILNACHIVISFLGFVIGFNLLIRCHKWYLYLVKALAKRLKIVLMSFSYSPLSACGNTTIEMKKCKLSACAHAFVIAFFFLFFCWPQMTAM